MNALANETSPYLLQHATNPVNWYPWGPEALARAKREDKPILLSIGYSACHWCHVMAHESFEDEATAALMNEHFINIKVDREERPDLDKIYQTAQHLLSRRSGGWPLTLFLTPDDQMPFFGGTYFPREPRYGLPGFKELLKQLTHVYTTERHAIRDQNAALHQMLATMQSEPEDPGAIAITSEPLLIAREQLGQAYDDRLGGFGEAPKFPQAPNLERLLRHHATSSLAGGPDRRALEMVMFTLKQMALGGIYDQIGGGFCRYSVDARWMIPHFEKMLYDNGPLLALYSEAWQLSRDPLYERIALETADWVIRDMQSPEGGFYSSLDADSEGHEGKFYVWTREEIGAILDERSYALFARCFGLDRQANFEGRWHLHVYLPPAAAAREFGLTEAEGRAILDEARRKLRAVRDSQRIWPGRDEKILSSWNGLMIKGLAIAGRIFGRKDYVKAAERALDFIKATLWRGGRLLATYKEGRAHLNAYLDDYAFLIDGILALLQARWRDGDLAFAIELAEVLLAQFEDREAGGFFFTSHDHEHLIQRTKPMADDALPSGAGIAAYVLSRLGHLLGEPRYLEACERTLKAAWPAIKQYPSAHNALLLALEDYLLPPEIIVLRGQRDPIADWHKRCTEHYAPRRLSLAINEDSRDLPGILANRVPLGESVAYVCEGLSCRQPIQELEALETHLRTTEIPPTGG
jgi:uncharacterized protein